MVDSFVGQVNSVVDSFYYAPMGGYTHVILIAILICWAVSRVR